RTSTSAAPADRDVEEIMWMSARAAVCAAALTAAFSAGAASAAAPGLQVLSSDPARVTGGDALVEVADPGAVRVTVNGADQTARFVRDPATGRLRGVVQGLRLGANEVTAQGP